VALLPIRSALATDAVVAYLDREWGLDSAVVTPLDGGMNSQTWVVTSRGRRWVAKAVGPAVRGLSAALEVASIVETAGIPAGAPMITRSGRWTVAVEGSELALLTFVQGTELTGDDDAELALIGGTLARVHLALTGRIVAGAERFPWLDVAAEHLDLRDWLRPAVAAALQRWDGIPPESMTWGLLHSDPAPEAFRFDAAVGDCGLIDWDRALVGPLMYDVASAVMYVGPQRAQPLLDAYVATGGLAATEVERTLDAMRAMRWAVQADYFALRIVASDLTGIAGQDENEKGLSDARAGLAALGI
jgi:homoserine kinase type II